jgi:uncharacterized protein YhfF
VSSVEEFWEDYVRSLPPEHRNRKYFEAFSFGDTVESADRLAKLVLEGEKTATSELLWSRQAAGKTLWNEGDESVVLNGVGEPVCVIRTTQLRVLPFSEVDEAFARDYGEGDRTLSGWRRDAWEYYEGECRSLGKIPSKDMSLICERFEVVYPPPRGLASVRMV